MFVNVYPILNNNCIKIESKEEGAYILRTLIKEDY